MIQKDCLEISVQLELGKDICLSLYGTSDKAKMFEDDDVILKGEARYQLVEGCEYEYEIISLQKTGVYTFLPVDEIIRFSKRHQNAGIIRTGVYVGTLTLSIVELLSGKTYENVIEIEVQSVKANYRTDYHNMLADITEYYTELLMIQGSPVRQQFEIDANSNSETLYQRFAFVQSIVSSEDFMNAIRKIISNPVKKWTETEINRKVSNIKHIDRSGIRQFVTSTQRISIPKEINGRTRMGASLNSVPQSLLVRYKTETEDIQENQFVKYVLSTFFSFCQNISQLKNAKKRLREESCATAANLRRLLDAPFFKNISALTHYNLNSPILQRKDGYRQVLQAWLMFDLAAKLSWSGGENVFSAGKRNVAALYEYWVFFKMLKLVSETFRISAKDKSMLVSVDEDRINLDLKQGKTTALRGNCQLESRSLNVCLYYNRTFAHHDDLCRSGSWTTTMRPDYTLSIWPGDDSSIQGEEEAEREDTIVHIHFDAKYRIASIQLIENLDDNSLAKEKDENEMHIYKRGDLLKMHAYKDAIRRTSGAYILYPGNSASKKIRGFHEIIPGLGAFCLSPSSADEDTKTIKSFLLDIREHLLNRASERERVAFYAHDTYDDDSNFSNRVLKDLLPETINDRRLLPNETFVLIGYYHDNRHLEWILKNNTYNFRAGYRNGSLNIDKEIVSAQYLLLHHGNSEIQFFKVSNKGPIVSNREELISKGYPQTLRKDGTIDIDKELKKAKNVYLLFTIEKAEDVFSNCIWEMETIKKHQGRQNAHPNCLSLTDLMLLREK